MLVFRHMPNQDDVSMRDLYRERAQRGMVLCAETLAAAYGHYEDFDADWGTLSVMAARGGPETYTVDNRSMRVDDDSYLTINAETRYTYRAVSQRPKTTMMVSFSARMNRDVTATLGNTAEALLDCPDAMHPGARLTERLRSHDSYVTPALQRIMKACTEGVDDAQFHEEHCSVLLERLIRRERAIAVRLEDLPAVKPATRAELARRVHRAMDFIHEAYDTEISLDGLSKIACLSRYHFLRTFRTINGRTPMEFVRQKRIAVAARLLAETDDPVSVVARLVGYRDCRAFQRAFARTLGTTPGACRRQRRSRTNRGETDGM